MGCPAPGPQSLRCRGSPPFVFRGVGFCARRSQPFADRRNLTLSLFHHKRAVSTITDIQPPVGDNGVDLQHARGVSITRTLLKAAPAPTSRHSLKTQS